MQEIDASDFKARCLALIDDVGASGSAEQCPQHTLRGTVTFIDEIERPIVPADNWNGAQSC
jgi:hypothetical protein